MKISFDANLNIITLEGALVSLHCHHYNCGLLKALEDMKVVEAKDILIQASAEEFNLNFSEYIKKYLINKKVSEILNTAEDLYRFMGLGRIYLTELNKDGGIAYADSSYYVVGWLAKYGRRNTPVCYLTCGFLKGILSAIYSRPVDDYKVIEKHCMITGHKYCEFSISVNE